MLKIFEATVVNRLVGNRVVKYISGSRRRRQRRRQR